MERDQKLLVKILEVCIKNSDDWKLDLSAKDIRSKFSSAECVHWSGVAVDGHIELLVDLGCMNVEGEAPDIRIQRVTNAGYNYLDRSKRLSLHGNVLPIH
ncbi:hypothetical protein LRQ11_23440 [Pseudomonas sp. MAFF 311095]|uniref:Uncharacterized protein n=1 Tax=Pseudomonas petroselini TaxID=2899822 RepID=A0ABS8QW73_9PSED|nr:hypothetical protein [Pseudomonas petroselini]MCD7039681.1 hypothetical protein [Pseudomonas petroselini]MCD7043331.1 hypothetical protein [Pseudomonas petroselini]MCD7067128.1 hypothetical protein [Pseudomonas petroselini]MCD7081597.1 hypothetical protein [Pseudomonas petroselini]